MILEFTPLPALRAVLPSRGDPRQTQMTIIPYNRKFKERARKLRKRGTLGEVLLWNELKRAKLRGIKFMRQKSIDNYIVDFFCKELMLAIEIDGEIHALHVSEDKYRQERLEIMGIKFLRFTEKEVRGSMGSVLERIKRTLLSCGRPLRGEPAKPGGV